MPSNYRIWIFLKEHVTHAIQQKSGIACEDYCTSLLCLVTFYGLMMSYFFLFLFLSELGHCKSRCDVCACQCWWCLDDGDTSLPECIKIKRQGFNGISKTKVSYLPL